MGKLTKFTKSVQRCILLEVSASLTLKCPLIVGTLTWKKSGT